MFNVGDLVRVIFLVSVLTHPIIHYADKRSRPVTCLAAVSPQSLFTREYCIVAVGTVNKSVGLKVKQFIWIIPWLFGLQPCLASAEGGHLGYSLAQICGWPGRGTVLMETHISIKQTLVDSA